MKDYTIDYANNAVEVSKKFAKMANEINSDAYKIIWRVKSSIKNKNIANARYCGILELIKDKEDAIGSGLQK